MKKIILGFVLSILLFVNASSVEVQAATAESEFSYEVKDDGTAKITACTAKGDIVIPETVGGYKVTELAPKLFYGVWEVTSVCIPKTVTTIGMWSYVFSYCYDLEAIYVDKDNQYFCSDDGILYDKKKEILYNYPCAKKLRKYTVPATVHSICCTAFADAWDLDILCIEGKDSVWATFTFYSTSDMKVYYRTGGKTEKCVKSHQEAGLSNESEWIYPEYMAWDCTAQEHANKNNWKYVAPCEATCVLEGRTASWCCIKCGMEIVPYEITELAPHPYGKWKVLYESTCRYEGESVRTCTYCGKQERKDLPKLTEHSFEEWETVTKATCEEAGEATRICTVCDKTEWKTIPATGYVVGAEIIHNYHIYTIKSIKGKKGTVVYKGPEEHIYRSLWIPKKIRVGKRTFTVTEIGKDVFKGDKLIKRVTIPSTVTKIGSRAFMNCKSMDELVIESSKLKSVGKNAIKGINKKAVIEVPKKKVKKYKKIFKKSTGYKKTMKIRKIWW